MPNLRDVLANVNGASFVSIDTLSPVPLKGGRANPHKGRVMKRVTGSLVMVFQNKNSHGYENMVRRRLEQEGKDPNTFVLGERAWGERIPNLPIVQHEKDGFVKHYMEVIFLRAGTTQYELDGVVVPKESIQGLQETVTNEDSQGGVENKVVIRTYNVESLVKIRIDRQEFEGPFTFA